MKKLGEILKEARLSKHISQKEAAGHLLLKTEIIESLEAGNWSALPEAAYVKGFIKNYAEFLGLDASRLLALHRAEYDEKKYTKSAARKKRRYMFTPNLLAPLTFLVIVLVFVGYLIAQYTSVVSAPRLEIFTPADDITTAASVIEVSGLTEKETTISIDGELVPVDELGNFNYQIKLEEGRNVIEIVASKRLSPKTKITRTIRLGR
jgi:cytoskeletal protein RodZ